MAITQQKIDLIRSLAHKLSGQDGMELLDFVVDVMNTVRIEGGTGRGRKPGAGSNGGGTSGSGSGPKKRGRPAKNASMDAPKRRGRPPKAVNSSGTPKKRGRPPKNKAASLVGATAVDVPIEAQNKPSEPVSYDTQHTEATHGELD